MAGPVRIWDHAAQNERTTLAWTRSALALLGVGLIPARVAYIWVPALGVLLATIAVATAMLLSLRSIRRYRHTARRLVTGNTLPDGRMPLALCLVTGVTSAWLILLRH